MAKAAPGDCDRQHRTGLRDDARHDRAGQRLSGRGRARGRFDGCRHVRDQGRRRGTAFGGHTIRRSRIGSGGRHARRHRRGTTGLRRDDGRRGHVEAKRHCVRGAGARTGHAARVAGAPTVDAGRGRGVEHAGPGGRRGPGGRCAHAADRRHRAQLHGTGQDAQHLPDHRGPAAAVLQRAANGDLDRDQGHPAANPGRISDSSTGRPASTTCCVRNTSRRARSRSWPR